MHIRDFSGWGLSGKSVHLWVLKNVTRNSITIAAYFILKSTWQRAGSATYMPHSSRNMHTKVIHTKLDVTLKLNTTIIKEAAISIWCIYTEVDICSRFAIF